MMRKRSEEISSSWDLFTESIREAREEDEDEGEDDLESSSPEEAGSK